MRVWALWYGETDDMQLRDLYESYFDAQREKDLLMDESMNRHPPRAASVIGMDTIPSRSDE